MSRLSLGDSFGMTLKVRAANIEDADKLAPLLRRDDIEEIKAAVGAEPLAVLKQGMIISDPCYTVLDMEDSPLAVFGVIGDSCRPSVGRIWLLGSDRLVQYSYTFLRYSREWIEKLHESYPTLWNYIDARNEVHIRWLKWCGFTFLRRIEKHGVEQRLFYEFERVSKLNQHFQTRRMAKKPHRTSTQPISPRLKHHDQIADLGFRKFHPVG